MTRNNFNTFFFSIIIPSVLAIGLFIISIFWIILPAFEKNMMDKKMEMISELTNTAWSLLDEYHQEFLNNKLSKKEAQKIAALRISRMRYGNEYKDYFWIIDMQPKMIMHPYRNDLIDVDLSNYKDPNGKKLFVEATMIINDHNDGYINYMWQWKDDSTRIVPKLSYVKGFKPWGWIVGTGIYLEDVKEEINNLEKRLIKISLIIIIIITIILSFIIRQSHFIEKKRKDAEDKLKLSRIKYKSLVEASTEGTLMIINKDIIFSNIKFSELIGYESAKIQLLKFEDIFNISWDNVISLFKDPKRSVSIETQLNCNNNKSKDVIISVSKIKYADDKGYIIIIKEITTKQQIKKEEELLSQELKTSLLLMNQPIKPYIKDILKCSVDTAIKDAAKLMTRKKRDIIFIYKDDEIIGIVSNSDLKNRVIVDNLNYQKPIMDIMSSPVISININSLLYEAISVLNKHNISYLGIKNNDDKITGVLDSKSIFNIQYNVINNIINEIYEAEEVEELKIILLKLPILVNALLETGSKTHHITSIITSFSDSITKRIIDLTIEDLGKPPCKFAFMVMGSEGRMEQTLFTDQDNAIVFEDQKTNELDKIYSYFQKLGQTISDNLHIVGYNYCKGDIMAKNPKWTQPLSIWKEYFSNWINESDPKSILDASIFFDFRCVYGNQTIVNNLHEHVNQAIDHQSVFFYHLASSITKYKSPLGIFGNIIGNIQSTDQINLDIKKILLPIVGFIRLYALYNKLTETNTLMRLKQLYQKKIIQKSMNDELIQSYDFLMHHRLKSQSINILENNAPDNNININQITQIEISVFKKIFDEIGNLQTKLNFDFKGTMN